MTVRLVTIFFLIGIFISGLAVFFFADVSPFKKDKLEELILVKQIEDGDFEALNKEIANLVQQGLIIDYLSPNAFLGFFLILASIFMFLMSLHISVDKLFLKKFYEKPSIISALRRSLIVVVGLALLLYLSLLGVLNIWLIFAVIIAGGIIDYLMGGNDSKLGEENTSQNEIVNSDISSST